MAATTPSGTPITSAKRTATVDSSIVAGRNALTSLVMARRVLIELPSSPRVRFPRNVRYCTYSGLSSPHFSLNAWTISGRWDATCPRFDTIGSDGTAWAMRNEMRVTPTSATIISPRRRATYLAIA